MGKENVPEFSPKIANAAAKGKFIDFNDNLILAKVNDYANIHGVGGKDHAPNSTINVVICDYSKIEKDANGESKSGTTTVSANVAPYIFEEILEICKKNVVSPNSLVLTTAMNLWTDIGNKVNQVHTNVRKLGGLFELTANKCMLACGHAIKKGSNPLMEFGKGLKELKAEIHNFNEKPFGETSLNSAATKLDLSYDWVYTQDKVNVYRAKNGMVPVSVVSITYAGYRPNGETSKLPWTVKVTNFDAPMTSNANGTSSYDGRQTINKKEAFIYLSNNDMWRCASQVCHYVDKWEMAYGIPLIKEGRKKMEEEKETKKNNGAQY